MSVARVRLDRPADRLLVRRIEPLSGSFECSEPGFALTATCGGRPVALRPCAPAPEARPACVRGFWTYLVVADWLDVAAAGRLELEFYWDGAPVGREEIVVSPVAAEVARRCPVPATRYPVALPVSAREPTALVFPGLGAVGGTSLCQLFRMEAHRRGWGVPVHHEADQPETWARFDLRLEPPIRWIDGHHCYDAGKRLGVGWQRVTMLREPERRLVSLFHYNGLVHPTSFPYRSLASFLESGTARRYSQAEGLLRVAGVRAPERMSNAELADAALHEMLSAYEFVGLTERFEESAFYLARLIGFDSVGMWVPTLGAPRREDLTDVPDRLAPALRDAVSADLTLYRAATDAFEQTLRHIDFGAPLERYQSDAAMLEPLSDSDKTVECLRWRQFLTETASAVTAARGRDTAATPAAPTTARGAAA